MKPICASFLPLLMTLVLACSKSESPTSIERTHAASASFAAASSGAVSAVTRTDDYDNGVDGTVDGRTVRTTWYDAHGNVTKEVFEQTLPLETAVRSTTVNEYNARGARLGYVFEFDDGADGTVDFRSTLRTLETNKQGDPIRQVTSGSTVDIVNEFDTRGRLIRSVLGPLTTTYGFDSHDNLVLYQTEISQGSGVQTATLEYNVHDVLVHLMQIAPLSGVLRVINLLSTVSYDAKGYPVQQVLDALDVAGNPSHTTRVITYDAHHNLLTQIDDVDYGVDGSVDSRVTSHWEYRGRNDVLFRQMDPAAAATGHTWQALAAAPPDPTGPDGGGKRGLSF